MIVHYNGSFYEFICETKKENTVARLFDSFWPGRFSFSCEGRYLAETVTRLARHGVVAFCKPDGAPIEYLPGCGWVHLHWYYDVPRSIPTSWRDQHAV